MTVMVGLLMMTTIKRSK